jgi:single-strand DNA-binding protein
LSLVKGSRVIVTGRLEQHSWETENGERRSKVEITAEEVGPSLRFATAEISRTERRGPGQADSAGHSDPVGEAEVIGVDA